MPFSDAMDPEICEAFCIARCVSRDDFRKPVFPGCNRYCDCTYYFPDGPDSYY